LKKSSIDTTGKGRLDWDYSTTTTPEMNKSRPFTNISVMNKGIRNMPSLSKVNSYQTSTTNGRKTTSNSTGKSKRITTPNRRNNLLGAKKAVTMGNANNKMIYQNT